MELPLLTVFIVSFLFAYLIVGSIYRLYFHPLSKFPGPRWAAITEYWELYQDYFRKEGGYLFIELEGLHEDYGQYFISLLEV